MAFKKPKVSFEEAMAGSRAERGLKALRQEADIVAPIPVAPTGVSVDPVSPPLTWAQTPPPVTTTPPASPASAMTPSAITAASPPASAPEDAVRLSIPVSAPHPAPGVSPSFDAIAADHGSRAAMLAILKRAWPGIEARLAAGEPLQSAASYPMAGLETGTTRRLTPDLLEVARMQLDPHGITSLRKLGRMLAIIALAAWFEQEGAR